MSRSNQTDLINPAVHFYQWNGDKGGFKYWDKTKGEKGETVIVPLPFTFIVLDTLSTIKGYNDAESSGYWSNEVRNIKEDILTVKSKGGLCAAGTYDKVIKDRNCNGAKYCQSAYVAIKEGSEFKIANIQITGAALSAWIEFRKKHKIYEIAIGVAKFIEGKKGKTIFQIPVFQPVKLSPEADAKAKELDVELQKYLSVYLKTNKEKMDGEVFVDGIDEDKTEVKKEAKSEVLKPTKIEAKEEVADISTFDDIDSDLPF